MKDSVICLLIIFIILISESLCNNFLIIPIISNKRRNIFLDFQDPKIQQYLSFEKLDAYNFLKRYYKESTYIELEAGTPPQKVISMLNVDITKCKCEANPLYQSQNNTNFFKDTYSFLLEKELEFKYDRLIGDGIDKFYFPISDTIPDYLIGGKIKDKAQMFLPFTILVECKNKTDLNKLNITFDFQLGMDFTTVDSTSNFIKHLKTNDLIPTYDFTVEYYKNPIINYTLDTIEVGRVIFGKFDEIYKSEEGSIKSTNLYQEYGRLIYGIGESTIYGQLKNEKIPISFNEPIYISFHNNLFEGSQEYFNHIKKYFFDKHNVMCNLNKYDYAYDDISFYVCSDFIELYKHEFPSLNIYINDFNYTFEFTFNDLFMKYDNHYYFLIVFGPNKEKWTFGNIFIRKYKLFFNVDTKKIMFFNGTINPNSSNIASKIIIIISIIILVLVLMYISYYIGKIINQRRKLRAHELDDNYDYNEVNK